MRVALLVMAVALSMVATTAVADPAMAELPVDLSAVEAEGTVFVPTVGVELHPIICILGICLP